MSAQTVLDAMAKAKRRARAPKLKVPEIDTLAQQKKAPVGSIFAGNGPIALSKVERAKKHTEKALTEKEADAMYDDTESQTTAADSHKSISMKSCSTVFSDFPQTVTSAEREHEAEKVNSMQDAYESLLLRSKEQAETSKAVAQKKSDANWQSKVNTQLCRFWVAGLPCENNKSNKCGFAHGEEELKPKTNLAKSFKTTACKKFVESTTCPYGSRCNFQHPQLDGRSNQSYVDIVSENLNFTKARLFHDLKDCGESLYINAYPTLTPRLSIFRSMTDASKWQAPDSSVADEEFPVCSVFFSQKN